MTKLVKKLLISLMALVMTVCLGYALGTQPVMAKAETETHSHCACGTTHQAIGSHTDEEEITWTPWDGTTEYKASGVTSYVYLSDDVVLDGTIYVDKNHTLYFCLNGKKLTAKSTGFRAFSVKGGGTLILTDCGTNVRQGYIDANAHLWTDGEANVSEGDIEYNITGGVIAGFDYSSEGGSIYVYNGKLYTYGVNICGNKTSSFDYGGGAIYISTDSTAELNNTTISGNVSPSKGSGLVAAGNAMVTMNKCTFNNNHINAPKNRYPDGGCVSVNRNNADTYATLTMKNCVFENNSSINRGYTAMTVDGIANLEDCEIINNKGLNGAIFVPRQGQLNLKNTTIKNNISTGGSAGGVYCSSGTINLSGRIVITDNTSGEYNTYNVYVDENFKINIVGDGLEEGSLIGIYGKVANNTNLVLVSQNDVDYSSYFISDRPESYHVEYNSDGNIIIANGKTEIYTVTFDVNGVECTAPTAQNINVGRKAKQPTLSNVDSYKVVGWYTDSACTNEFSFDTAITEDITLYAKWVIGYDVWVAGIQLDSTNTTIDNEDNNAINGSATYDPTSNTLTLDNFSYTGADYYLYDIEYNSEDDEYYHRYAGIYSKGDLNIVLNGENALNCAIIDEDSDRIYKTCVGINVDGALTIGGGTLNATVEGNVIVAKTLRIDNATLNSISTGMNIFLYGDAIISNSKVFAKGGTPVIAMEPDDELNIINSTVVIQSEDSNWGLFYASAINIDENSVLEISVSNCAIRNTITVIYSKNCVVYAGENKENAQLVAEPDATTYENKYVKIVPVRKVTVNYGISELSNKEISIEQGETLSLESPEIDGYVFIGWYNEDTLETAFDFSTPISKDIAIYAKFANYTQDMADIDRQINDVKGSITSLQSIIDGKADAADAIELANSVTDLQGKINALTNNYQSADTAQQNEIDTLKQQVSTLINDTIVLLNSKVTDIESEIVDISNAISKNESDITANADKISTLTNNLGLLQGVVDGLDNTFINDTELSNAIDGLKDELDDADSALNDLISALTNRVSDVEDEIDSLVANKADVTLVTEKVEELKGLINSLDAVKNNYVTADEELKNQLTTVINNAKQQAIDSATTLVNNAKAELTIAINAKADTATVNAKVEELNNAIATAGALANAYTDGKVTELTTAIATAKQQAIDSATTLVNNAKTELNAAIALKADNATVIAKFAEVDSAIAILQGLSDDYLSADTELKEELTTLIANTKAEIIELIIAGDKANADALEEEIAKLRAEIEAVKNATNEDIKEAESNAQVLPTVIASVAVLGDIALLVWLIIKRKIVK